jgi:hypothetical protein
MTMTMKRFAAFLIVIVSSSFSCIGANAQTDPRGVLWEVIKQLQTGTPIASWYGPQLWEVMRMQTGNSGIYPQLVSLGPVQTIDVNQSANLPNGTIYRMTANHVNGKSTWNFGINRVFNRIEYANFEVGGAVPPVPLPTPKKGDDTPGGPVSPHPDPDPGSGSTPTSDACKKFPNLC